MVQFSYKNVLEFELAATIHFGLEGDVTSSRFDGVDLPGLLTVDFQCCLFADECQPKLVPHAWFHESFTLGGGHAHDVTFVSLQEIDLVTFRPRLTSGRQFAANVDP